MEAKNKQTKNPLKVKIKKIIRTEERYSSEWKKFLVQLRDKWKKEYPCLNTSLMIFQNQERENPISYREKTGYLQGEARIRLPGGTSGKEAACPCRRHRRRGFVPLVRKTCWRTKWQCAPVFLPGKFHGQRKVAGYSPWVTKSQTWLSTNAQHTQESV